MSWLERSLRVGTRFKVGDRVIVTGDSAGWHHRFLTGETGIVVNTDRGPGQPRGNYEHGIGCSVEGDDGAQWDVCDDDLERL